MSELGLTVDQLREQGVYRSFTISNPVKPIGIKTPLERGKRQEETLFKMHFNISDQIRDNLKNLIMTQQGERLGFPDFGTRLKEIYSNNDLTEDDIADIASREIQTSVEKYMPSISLTEFYSKKLSSQNKSENFANENALDFLSIQNQTKINLIGDPEVEEINKDNIFIDSFFEITIRYSIPLLGREDELVLIVNSSK